MEMSILNLRRWFLIVFAVSCLGLNLVAYVLYKKNQEVIQAKDWVEHTYAVVAENENLFSQLQDMETAQRGFLLTGDANFLGPYHKASQNVDLAYAHLLTMTSDNAGRQKQLQTLGPILVQQRNLLEREIKRKRGQNNFSIADMEENKKVMDQIRALNDEMQQQEENLIATRTAKERNQQKNYVGTVFLSAALSVIGLLIANGVIFFLTLRRQAAEDDLRRINKEMEGFTYITSHDLRSPLVNLKGFATEMSYGLEEVSPLIDKAMVHLSEEERKKIFVIIHEDIPDALRYIHSSVEKMDKLTSAILELSRIGRRTLKLETVDATRIVQHCLETLHHQITTKGITVKVQPLPPVVVDPLSLEQVFSNVIDNAVKYLDPNRPGKIEIGGSRTYRETTYWVKDNGRGISEHDQQKIFEIYRRGGNNQNIPGEGMGMAYVRATLRRLDGAIWCDSVAGTGTTFYFTISNSLQKEEKE